jgi:hypothetical protein
MWVTLGRLRPSNGTGDAALARTTAAIAEGAARLPGHIATRLFATTERDELYFVTAWQLESAALTYSGVLAEDHGPMAAGFGAEVVSIMHLEEIASFPEGVRSSH